LLLTEIPIDTEFAVMVHDVTDIAVVCYMQLCWLQSFTNIDKNLIV